MSDNNSASKKKWGEELQSRLLVCCHVFVSESRDRGALEAIERAAREDSETSVIVKFFDDREYNRARFTIVSYLVRDACTGTVVYSPLHRTVVALAEAAFAAVDLRAHTGAHPRLGVVDDIVFHPLARTSLDDAACLARNVALEIAHRFQVPVYLYAAAHPTGKALDTIRRELGYYQPNFTGNLWAGWTLPDVLPEKPDEGPTWVAKSRGISMVGARPWLRLYNVPIQSTDIPTAKRIARMVSARGGGLPTVQSLALVHGNDSVEIACYLLEPDLVGADLVQNRVEALAAEEGLGVEKGYFTDNSPEIILERYAKLISANTRV